MFSGGTIWLFVLSLMLAAIGGWWKWFSLKKHQAELSDELEALKNREQTEESKLTSSGQEDISIAQKVAQSFTEAKTKESALQSLVNFLHRLTRARSVVVFLPVEDKLIPVAHRSPSEKLAESYQILDLGEECIHHIWPNKSAIGKGLQEDTRYFPGEKQSLAFAIGNQGVLYLGHQNEDGLDEKLLALLPALASQAALGLLAVESREAEMSALQSRAEILEKLRASEAQLVQSSKLAAVGVLAAGIAHELNTPIATIRLGLDFVSSNLEKRPEQCSKMLSMACDGVSKSQEIVNKLLHYCREGSQEQQLFSLDEVVQDAIGFLDHHLEQEGVKIDKNLEASAQVLGNKNEIQQVLSNLVMNAKDAVLSGEFEKRVLVSTELSEDNIFVDVRDFGPGISEDLAQKIFDPFFTTKALGEGTGLGLSISLQIVEKHGGTLTLVPVKQGTKFRVTLPRSDETS